MELSNAIRALLREPVPAMILDMGLGSREQNMPAQPARRVRFILSEQALPGPEGSTGP